MTLTKEQIEARKAKLEKWRPDGLHPSDCADAQAEVDWEIALCDLALQALAQLDMKEVKKYYWDGHAFDGDAPDTDVLVSSSALSQPAEGWREMASAPKDEKIEVLVWNGWGFCIAAYWGHGAGREWWHGEGYLNPDPTHWKPLSPPQGTKGGKL